MDVPARVERDRAVITGSAGPGAGKGAVPPWFSRGSGQPVSPTGAEAVHLLALGAYPQPQDRWGGTPLSDLN